MSTSVCNMDPTPEWVAPGLYRRGEKIYARVRIKGRRTFFSTGTSKLSKAQRVLDSWREQQILRKHGIEPKSHIFENRKLTVTELIDEYVAAGQPRENRRRKETTTIDTETKAFRKLNAFFGGMVAKTLSVETCDDYQAWRARGGYKWTRRKEHRRHAGTRIVDIELQALDNAIEYAVRRKKVQSNPIAGRPHYHDPAGTHHCREFAPTPSELLQVKEHLEQTMHWVERNCVLFQAGTGLRVREALRLEWPAIHREKGIIAVKRSKKGINPWVPILPEVETLLDEMESRRGSSRWLFPSVRNPHKPLPYETYQRRLKKLVVTLKIKPIHSHGLRSFFVTAAREAGLTDPEIAALIGNKTVSIIATTYGDTLPEHLINQARRIRLLLRPALLSTKPEEAKTA